MPALLKRTFSSFFSDNNDLETASSSSAPVRRKTSEQESANGGIPSIYTSTPNNKAATTTTKTKNTTTTLTSSKSLATRTEAENKKTLKRPIFDQQQPNGTSFKFRRVQESPNGFLQHHTNYPLSFQKGQEQQQETPVEEQQNQSSIWQGVRSFLGFQNQSNTLTRPSLQRDSSDDFIITSFKPAKPSQSQLQDNNRPFATYSRKPPMFQREWKERVRSDDQRRLDELRQQENRFKYAKRNGFFNGDFESWNDNMALRQAVYNLSAASLRRNAIDPEQKLKEQTDLERILNNAKKSFQAPKIDKPTLDEFNRLTLRDEKIEKSLEPKGKKRRFPTRMDNSTEIKVKKYLNDQSFSSEITGAQVDHKDLVRLKPSSWLNNEIINFFGVLLNNRCSKYMEKHKELVEQGKGDYYNIHVFSSFMLTKYESAGYPGVKRWTRRIDLFSKDKVIVPVNLGNAHWTCACINIKEKRFEYYDSLGSAGPGTLRQLRDYLQQEHKDKKKSDIDLSDWEDYFDPDNYPQQENGFDCGMFTIMAMEHLSRRNSVYDWSQDNMPYLRSKFVLDIAEKEIVEPEWED